MGEVLIAGMAAMLICIFLGPKFIEYLRVKEFGQHIREEGPQEHHAKAGTPTMGGLIVFASICVPYLVLSDRDAQSMAVFGVALGCAGARLRRRLHQDRQAPLARPLGPLQAARASCCSRSVLWWVARHEVGLEPTLFFRIGDASVDLGPVLYFVLVFLVIAGTSNGVNLTDGLDGLAAGSCAIVLLAYTAITFVTNDQQDLALLSACLVGACIGFLWFNAFPASIFMGDTGSLGLGGAIGALAVMTQTEVLLIIIGGIFVIEALSVAIQVFAFKTFRRRVLLMAPLHHHFEMMAWSETKIMLRFWIIAAVCSGIGFTLYQQSIGPLGRRAVSARAASRPHSSPAALPGRRPDLARLDPPEIELRLSGYPLADLPSRGRGRDEMLSQVIETYFSGWVDYQGGGQGDGRSPATTWSWCSTRPLDCETATPCSSGTSPTSGRSERASGPSGASCPRGAPPSRRQGRRPSRTSSSPTGTARP